MDAPGSRYSARQVATREKLIQAVVSSPPGLGLAGSKDREGPDGSAPQGASIACYFLFGGGEPRHVSWRSLIVCVGKVRYVGVVSRSRGTSLQARRSLGPICYIRTILGRGRPPWAAVSAACACVCRGRRRGREAPDRSSHQQPKSQQQQQQQQQRDRLTPANSKSPIPFYPVRLWPASGHCATRHSSAERNCRGLPSRQVASAVSVSEQILCVSSSPT